MTKRRSMWWFPPALLILAIIAVAIMTPAWGAQPAAPDASASPLGGRPNQLPEQLAPPIATDNFPQLSPISGLGDVGLGDAGDADKILVFSAFTDKRGDQPARLFVTAKLGPKWHVYSLTQPAGAVKATTIELAPSDEFQLLGSFVPDQAAEVRETEVFDVPLEEHYGTVTFSAPIEITAGVDPARMRITGKLSGMLCHDEQGCLQLADVDTSFSAQLATGQDAQDLLFLVPTPDAEPEGYRAEDTHAVLTGHIIPKTIEPGTAATLVISAEVDPGWKIYAFEEKTVPDGISKPFRIALQQPDGWDIGPAKPSTKAKSDQIEGFPPYYYHEGSVTWTAAIGIPADAPPGEFTLEGLIGYQTCSNQCDRPVAAKFSTRVNVATPAVEERAALVFSSFPSYEDVELLADAAAERRLSAEPTQAAGFNLEKTAENTARKLDDFTAFTFWLIVVPAALVGGLLLNVMPCVLPVIGLKIMGFVSQAGESRGRIFALNVWYALGLLSVFLILATPMALLNATASSAPLEAGQNEGWGWGEQFNSDVFNIPIIAIVFVMALSFFGVWEIPIPGFAAGSTATKLAEKEGPAGAFAKGVVTTILATPCTGPGIAFAMTWCRAMSVPQVYIFFGAIALGMATPYLIIGAFPKLIKALPKPGAWMETVKQVMGFVLLATVIWLYTNIQWVHVVPTLALLFGLGAACWWIGRVSITASFQQKARAWIGAGVFAALIGFFAFLESVTVGGFPIPGLRGMMQHRFQESIETEIANLSAAIADGDSESVASADGRPGNPRPADPFGGTIPTVASEGAADDGGRTEEPENEFELPWERFSIEKLKRLTAEQKTVMVDFTADWCLTCKTLEQFVLNTQAVREVVDRNGVVTLMGNWSRNPEVGTMLSALNSKQVPVLAIFPPGRPNDPIVLSGPYTKATLIKALEEAGPSQGFNEDPRAAMR